MIYGISDILKASHCNTCKRLLMGAMWCKTMEDVNQRSWENRACHSVVCAHLGVRVCFELEWTWHSDLSWSKCTFHNSCSEITHQNHHQKPSFIPISQQCLSVLWGSGLAESKHSHTEHKQIHTYILSYTTTTYEVKEEQVRIAYLGCVLRLPL